MCLLVQVLLEIAIHTADNDIQSDLQSLSRVNLIITCMRKYLFNYAGRRGNGGSSFT